MNGGRLITDYPPDRGYLGMAGLGAVCLHLFLALLVAFVAWLFEVKSLQQLMSEGGAVEQTGPAPADQVEISFVPEEEPPPPTVTPDFAREVIKPPPAPPVPVTKPKVTDQPKPAPKPRYVEQGATGQGESSSISHLTVGSSGFPRPTYPFSARKAHQTGTVTVNIQFDGSGRAVSVQVVTSSGLGVLDNNTRSFIRANWRNPAFAGQNCTVPVEYNFNVAQ